MEELRNLQDLYRLAAEKFTQYDGKDFILPELFKKQVKEINNSTISYNRYSAIIKTKGTQNGVLNIYLPNQWFFIASYFTDFYNELQKYKRFTLKAISKERLKELNEKSLSNAEMEAIHTLPLNETSQEYLVKFVTEYSWWGGAKTIDRGDFYVSPILNCAKLVNASQSFVADLCAFLADKKTLVQVIITEGECLENVVSNKEIFSLQQIYYGAPGTGKSHEIKEQTAEAEEQGRVFRTTFHPDSDYSTFVGCYKPTISQKAVRNVAGDVVKRDGKEVFEDYISYQFVPQAFTNAYVKAWQTNEPVFLIIEEINRGNCAQIFGDLFQLLDRGDDGVSDYPIKADTDLCQYLEKELGEDGSKGIKDGKLCLPANLHIWATMNTSDQSLFPIDSAFKRRWDWHYTPICNAKKGWKVEANGNQYDWWDFLQKINERIERATSSEDKQLGYFFCKADGNGVISAEKFVSKVIFYLWNDVFKDFADSSDDPFKVADGNRMTFRTFYTVDENGKTIVNEDNVEALFGSLGVDFFSKTTSEEEIEEEDEFGDNSNKPKYSINGVGEIPQNRLAEECLREYIKLNPEQSVEEVLAKWKGLGNIVSHFVESKDEFDARTDSKKYRSTAVHCKDSVIYIANDGYSAKNGKTEMLLNAVNSKNWGIKVAKVVKVA